MGDKKTVDILLTENKEEKVMETKITLENALLKNNVKKITKWEEIEKLFDINQLDKDGTPKILTDKKTLIIFDNQDFNETYLIDLINDYMATEQYFKENNVPDQIFYIDDVDIRKELFCPNVDATDTKVLEKNYFSPGFIVLNKETSVFAFLPETKLQILVIEMMPFLFGLLNHKPEIIESDGEGK